MDNLGGSRSLFCEGPASLASLSVPGPPQGAGTNETASGSNLCFFLSRMQSPGPNPHCGFSAGVSCCSARRSARPARSTSFVPNKQRRDTRNLGFLRLFLLPSASAIVLALSALPPCARCCSHGSTGWYGWGLEGPTELAPEGHARQDRGKMEAPQAESGASSGQQQAREGIRGCDGPSNSRSTGHRTTDAARSPRLPLLQQPAAPAPG